MFHTARFWLFFVASALNVRLTRLNHYFNGARERWVCAHLRQTVCRLSRRGVRCSCQKTFCAPSFVVRQPTHRLPQMGGEGSTQAADLRTYEAGEAFTPGVGKGHQLDTLPREGWGRWGPVGKNRHWRCEPAFFAYFLCGGKESRCRPAQGQRMKHEGKTRMPAQTQKHRMPAQTQKHRMPAQTQKHRMRAQTQKHRMPAQ
ncbi:MAG TPA: hypothetical protein VN289_05900 [Paraburkholderia sp.]|nr:hypothetical protein [Paraburkholderia sp.]